MSTAVLVVSLLLQIAAAVLALRLMRVTERRTVWLVLAAALTLMAVRRAITLYHVAAGERTVDLAAELVAFLISSLFVLAIGRIAPMVESIRRAEKEVRQLVEAAPDAMVMTDERDKIVLVNAQTVRLFGWSRHELIGRDAEMLVPERLRERHRERRVKYHETPRPHLLGADDEVFGLRKDGSEFPAEVSVSPLESTQGKLVVSAIRDVHARREAEAALKESEGRYRSLLDDVLDSSSVGVCIVDAGFRIVWVNKAYEGHFGINRREVIGLDARRIVRERLRFLFDDPVAFGQKVLATYENNTYIEGFECRIPATDERAEVWLYHRSQPIESGLYAGGRIEHFTDITERQQAEVRINLFAQIARNMQIGLLVYRLDDPADDRSLRVLAVNPEGEKMLGVAAGAILGRCIDDVFPDLRKRGIPSMFAEVVVTGEAREVEDFHYRDNHTIGDAWSFKAFPLPDASVGVVFESIAARKRIEDLVQHIAKGVSGETGAAFFRSLVKHLAGGLGLEYALVGELEGADKDRIRTIAMWANGEVADNVAYDLDGTPCSNVIGRHVCCHPDGVQERFPRDHMLVEMGVACYVGSPLFDSEGQPLGLVAVLGRDPLKDPEIAQSVLQIFGSRAAIELERRRAANSRPG